MTNKGTSVSVVIPMYNAEKWIRETLSTVVEQSYSPNECIVIDDGSTDRGAEIVKKFSNYSPIPIKLIQTSNMGVSNARNTGIAEANSNLIAFLDADDLWNPRKLEKQIELMDSTKSIMCICGYEVFNSSSWKSQGIVAQRYFDKALRRWLAVEGDGLAVSSTALVKKEKLEEILLYNPKISICEDLDMVIRLHRSGRLCLDPTILTGYRSHSFQEHRRIDRVAIETTKLYDTVFPTSLGEKFEKRCRANLSAHVAYGFLIRRNYKEVGKRLRQSTSTDPIRVVTLPFFAMTRRIKRIILGLINRRRFFFEMKKPSKKIFINDHATL